MGTVKPRTYQRTIPIVIVFIASLAMLVEYYLPQLVPGISTVSNTFRGWSVIVSSFSLILGGALVAKNSMEGIRKQKKGWQFIAWRLSIMIVTLVIGLVYGLDDSKFMWIFNNMFTPILTTTMTLGMVYFIGGAYHAYNFKSVEASILAIFCILGILNYIPVGEVIWTGFTPLGNWAKSVIQAGAYHGFLLGGGLGAIVLGVRVMLGQETGFLGGEIKED